MSVIIVGILLLGPFQSLISKYGINDKFDHAVSFYLLTLITFGCFPTIRKFDILLGIIFFGAVTEIIQFFVGREMNLYDWFADIAGALICALPLFVRNALHPNKNDRRSSRVKKH